VWIGALGGVALSVVLGVVFIVLFYVAGTEIFSGRGATIFKGTIMWLASLLITLVAFQMLKFYNLERKWKRKLENVIAEDVNKDKEVRRRPLSSPLFPLAIAWSRQTASLRSPPPPPTRPDHLCCLLARRTRPSATSGQ
jgi:hypothetical protein